MLESGIYKADMNEIKRKEIKQAIDRAPIVCGCYLWKDKDKNVLYIGKAQNLRSRLRSYIGSSPANLRTLKMLAQADSIEWIITQTENEALLLEANLVKKYLPRFNVLLKDDKRYPYLCLSIAEPYPQLFLTRQIKYDGNLYFGPYSDVRATRNTLALIHKIFPIRKVRQRLPLKQIKRPCINFHIKRCLGPCQPNVVDQSEYRKIVDEISLFLEGKAEILEKLLQERMASYSAAQIYEKAAMYRDTLRAVRKVTENQIIQTQNTDQDILALARHEDHGQIVIIEVRQGRMIGRKSFPLSGLGGSDGVVDSEVIEAFIRDYYLSASNLPSRIQVPEALAQKKLLTSILEQRVERKVRFAMPYNQEGKSLQHMALRNAEFLLRDRLLALRAVSKKDALEHLRTLLGLARVPEIMECYDISHIQGHETVASGVLFIDGYPQRTGYRHYRIREVEGIDDPASIKEVVGRRIQRLLGEGRSLPDLFLIDGGITQVNAAKRASQEFGSLMEHEHLRPYFVGLAKKREELYLPGENQPRIYDPSSPGMLLLRQMRNEAHRFALKYHRIRRNRSAIHHLVEELCSIGATRKKALLHHFKHSSTAIERASVTEFSQVPGIGKPLAAKIHDFFCQIRNKA